MVFILYLHMHCAWCCCIYFMYSTNNNLYTLCKIRIWIFLYLVFFFYFHSMVIGSAMSTCIKVERMTIENGICVDPMLFRFLLNLFHFHSFDFSVAAVVFFYILVFFSLFLCRMFKTFVEYFFWSSGGIKRAQVLVPSTSLLAPKTLIEVTKHACFYARARFIYRFKVFATFSALYSKEKFHSFKFVSKSRPHCHSIAK